MQRSTDPKDKRGVVLSLTSNGKSNYVLVVQAENALDSFAESLFTAEEKSVMATAFRRFLSNTASGEAIQGRFATRRKAIK